VPEDLEDGPEAVGHIGNVLHDEDAAGGGVIWHGCSKWLTFPPLLVGRSPFG
jgi:hypothetical protein